MRLAFAHECISIYSSVLWCRNLQSVVVTNGNSNRNYDKQRTQRKEGCDTQGNRFFAASPAILRWCCMNSASVATIMPLALVREVALKGLLTSRALCRLTARCSRHPCEMPT